ncbi:MAG: NAD-dependent epimerase/dehydratase family protein [Maribacter sp.]
MVLVTGGTGLVGSHLLLRLAMNDTKVRALYRTQDKLEHVKKIFSYYTTDIDSLFHKIEWVQGDILDIPLLELAFVQVTQVYHCAALISFTPSDFEKLERVNREGTANMVNLAIAKKIQKMCFVSTIGTIGRSLNGEAVDEETEWTIHHANPYAITKHLGEMEVWRGFHENLNMVIVNPGVILGPGFWESGSGTFFKTAAKGYTFHPPGGSGFISVSDVTKIMVHLMDSDISGERFIAVTENLSYKEVLAAIATAMGKNRPKYELKSWQLQVGRCLDWIRHIFYGTSRTITKNTIYGLLHPTTFDAAKLKKSIPFQLESIRDTIEKTTAYFIEEQTG